MDYSPPGSSVHGILQARILEWVAISSSRGASQPKDQTHIFCTGGWILSCQRSPVIRVTNTLFKSPPIPLLPPFLRNFQINDHTYNVIKIAVK